MERLQNANKKSLGFETSEESDKITDWTKREVKFEWKGRRARDNPKGEKVKEQESDSSDQETP